MFTSPSSLSTALGGYPRQVGISLLLYIWTECCWRSIPRGCRMLQRDRARHEIRRWSISCRRRRTHVGGSLFFWGYGVRSGIPARWRIRWRSRSYEIVRTISPILKVSPYPQLPGALRLWQGIEENDPKQHFLAPIAADCMKSKH